MHNNNIITESKTNENRVPKYIVSLTNDVASGFYSSRNLNCLLGTYIIVRTMTGTAVIPQMLLSTKDEFEAANMRFG